MITLLVGVSKQVTESLYSQSISQCQQRAIETESSSRLVGRSPGTWSATRRLHYSIENNCSSLVAGVTFCATLSIRANNSGQMEQPVQSHRDRRITGPLW